MVVIIGSLVYNQRVEWFNCDLNIYCVDVIKIELYELEY